VTKDVFDHLYG